MLPPHAVPSPLPPVYRDGYKKLLDLRAMKILRLPH